MKLPENKKFKWNYLGIAFAIPTTLMLVLMFITSAQPFGKYSMLYSDMFHQYYPFFRAFRDALRSGESLLWNWSAGMGMDYLGLISYYLASPLNLLSVLVPDSFVLGYFALLMPIKLGLASLTFAYMLKKLFGSNDLSISLFGSFYGMCAWALGYQWNVMWLDSFALLPLVVLGTVLLLRDKKFVLYTVSLFLSIFINYYIGFFICIFVFLLFFCYEICRFKSFGRLITDLCRIAFFSFLAIGMTAILELPALAALQNTQSSVNNFPSGFDVNIVSGEAVSAAKEAWNVYKEAKASGAGFGALWGHFWNALKLSFPPLTSAMSQIAGNMGGGISPTFIDGLPNLYCGVFPIALGFLFLLAKDVKVRDKLCSVFLLLFFMISFVIRQLDYIWHGFHFTNQIPYRFSFLFSFVLLYMAYRVWLLRDQLKLWQIVTAGILSLGLILIPENRKGDLAYLSFNLAFLGLYLVAMVYGHKDFRLSQPSESKPEAQLSLEEGFPEESELPPESAADPVTEESAAAEAVMAAAPVEELLTEANSQKAPQKDPLPPPETRRRQAAWAIAAVMVLELVLNLANFGVNFGIYNYDYPKNGDATASMIRVMKELEGKDAPFYRAEVTHSQTLNDGPLNGYNGISTFTSSANVKVTEFMKKMGYGAYSTYNRYCYEDASPVANLFLNLKYMIERETAPAPNSCFDVVHSYKGVTLLRNNAYLPMGFLAETELKDLDFSKNSSFQFQNRLFQAATGLEDNVWSWVSSEDLHVDTENVTLTVDNVSGYTSFKSGSGGGKVIYEYKMTQEGFMCLDLNLYAQKNLTVWHNGQRLYREGYSLPQMLAVCNVVPGDTVQVMVECGSEVQSAVQIHAAVLNEAVFRKGYDILNASTLELIDSSTTHMEGFISCNRDGLLYTSIPQDGNWIAYVDGERAEQVLIGDAMIALTLTEGEHTIEFRYRNDAFRIGTLISLGCAATFGGILLTRYLIQRKKKQNI